MPYGTPIESGIREYTLLLRSVESIGEYPVEITCTALTDNMNDETELPEIWQQFVDFVGDGGTHFNVVRALRTKHHSETVTPTA